MQTFDDENTTKGPDDKRILAKQPGRLWRAFLKTKTTPSPDGERPVWGKILHYFEQEAAYGHLFLWVPVLIILGVVFNLQRPDNISNLAVIGVLSLLFFLLLWATFIGQFARRVLIAALCFFSGVLLANLEHERRDILLDQDVTTDIEGIILSHQLDENNISRYQIEITQTKDPKIRRPPLNVQLVARARHEILQIGTRVEGRARLTRPSGPVFPGGYDFAFHAFTQEIGAYGYFMGTPKALAPFPERKLSVFDEVKLSINALRAHISYRIKRYLDGDQGAIASALTVADRKSISKDTVTALRDAGLAHILAISGLHMVLAAGTLFVTIRMSLLAFPAIEQSLAIKKIAAMGAMITATSYLVLSGAPISAQRAWIMLMIMLGAILADRPALTLRNVAIAAILIVIISPSAVLLPGFQMSFAAAAALVSIYSGWATFKDQHTISFSQDADKSKQVLLGGRIFKPLKAGLLSLSHIMIALALTAFIAGLASGIFAIQHFYKIASFGVLANVLAMPLVTFLIMPLALLSLLLMPLGLEAWPLWLLGISITWVIDVANFVSGLGGTIAIGYPDALASALSMAGFVTLICLKTPIRFIGLLAVIIGLILHLMHEPERPDILISENGRLVGVILDKTVLVNRQRPSQFVIDQWEGAYLIKHIPSQSTLSRQDAKSILSDTTHNIWTILDAQMPQFGRQTFQCLDANFCYFETEQLKILTIGRYDYLPFACKNVDLLIVSLRLNKRRLDCDNGPKHIVDQNQLRRTGALAIKIDPSHVSPGADLLIDTAIAGKVRPWTLQRYYDWRSRTYQLPTGEIIRVQ